MFQHRFSLAVWHRSISQTHSHLICGSVCFLHQFCCRNKAELFQSALTMCIKSFFSTPTHSLFIHETMATTQIHLSFQISGPVIVTSMEHKLYSHLGGSSCGGPYPVLHRQRSKQTKKEDPLPQAIWSCCHLKHTIRFAPSIKMQRCSLEAQMEGRPSFGVGSENLKQRRQLLHDSSTQIKFFTAGHDCLQK